MKSQAAMHRVKATWKNGNVLKAYLGDPKCTEE